MEANRLLLGIGQAGPTRGERSAIFDAQSVVEDFSVRTVFMNDVAAVEEIQLRAGEKDVCKVMANAAALLPLPAFTS